MTPDDLRDRHYGIDIAPDGTETLAEATLNADGTIDLSIVRLVRDAGLLDGDD